MKLNITRLMAAMTLFMMGLVANVAMAFPTQTTNYKNLNIIDTVQITIPMTTKEGGWASCDINPLLEHTGMTIEEASANIGKIMQIWKYDSSETAEDYYVADELWPMETWGYWWFSFADDEHSTFVASEWSGNCCAWTGGNVSLGEDGICWIFFGPYTIDAGTQMHTQLYAIIGNDAIQYNIDVEVEGIKLRTLEECELKGETTIYTNNQISNGWNGKSVRFDMQEVYSALGCGVADIQVMCVDSLGYLNPTFTSNAGFWMTPEGDLINYEYGRQSWFAELNPNNGSFNVGHMPGAFVGDGTEVCKGSVYVTFYDYIYKINLEMTIIPDREMPTEFTAVGGEELYLQAKALDPNWTCGTNVQLGYDRACELTECAKGDELTLYARNSIGEFIKTCTVTTADGFWFTPWGIHTYYGQESAFFIENVYRGHIGNWGHMAGADEDGTSYTGEFYLMNEANGKYYTITYRVDFLSEVIAKEVVAEEDITVLVGSEGDVYTKLDTEKLYAALGVEAAEAENIEWLTPGFGGYYRNDNANGTGYYFDPQGKTVNYEDEEAMANAIYFLSYTEDDGYPALCAQEWTPLSAEAVYKVKLCAEYNGKQYIYNVTVMSDANTAIKSANATDRTTQMYNLQGIRVNDSYRGIVIKNGVKVVK